MKFVRIVNIGDHEEIILNIEHISVLGKNKKYKMECSENPPYEFVRREQIKGEFEYFVLMKDNRQFNINKENYELIKSKIGV